MLIRGGGVKRKEGESSFNFVIIPSWEAFVRLLGLLWKD